MSKIWKVVVIVLASVIGAVGVVFLSIYLAGGFSPNYVYPENIFFASSEEDLTDRGSLPYNEIGNFEVMISTTTEDVSQDEISLSFPTNQSGSTVRFLQQVALDSEFVSEAVVLYYAYDDEGNIIKFASCGEDNADYITNGIIIVPLKVKINQSFEAKVCLAPNNTMEEIIISEDGVENDMYNLGGYSQIIARSSNNAISYISTTVNIDVPVEEINVIGITGENIGPGNILGLNEYSLKDSDTNGYCEIGTESDFSVILDITPARAVYKYGRNGEVGTVEYKKVVFSINSDEGLIAFANSEGEELLGVTEVNGVRYIYNSGVEGISLTDLFGEEFDIDDYNISIGNWASQYGSEINAVEFDDDKIFISVKNVVNSFEVTVTATPKNSGEILTAIIYGNDSSLKDGAGLKITTIGTRLIAKNIEGDCYIRAGIFKNAILEDTYASIDQNNGLIKEVRFDVREIDIDGFGVTDRYNFEQGGEGLDLTVNERTVVYANNLSSEYSLGIEINSNISAQNQIKNILISIQYSLNETTWFDATQINGEIPALFIFDSENVYLTGNDLGIEDEDDENLYLKTFRMYRPQGSSNMSYWEIIGASAADRISNFGIQYIRIYVYYLSPDTDSLVLDNINYGPHDIDVVVNEIVEPDLEWDSDNALLNNEQTGAGNFNERVLLDEQDIISLENIAFISNLIDNPNYTTLRYFIYNVIKWESVNEPETAPTTVNGSVSFDSIMTFDSETKEYTYLSAETYTVLVGDIYYKVVIISDGEDTPTYTAEWYIKIVENLDDILNVSVYEGGIPGISSNYTIYEVDPTSDYLICSDLEDYNEIDFRLIFAVVENDFWGLPVVYNDGGVDDEDYYRIISLPTDENYNLLYAPIKIKKTLNTITVDYDKTEYPTDYLALVVGSGEDASYVPTYFVLSENQTITYGEEGFYQITKTNGDISYVVLVEKIIDEEDTSYVPTYFIPSDYTDDTTYDEEGIYQIKDDNDAILYLALVEKVIDGETTSYVPTYFAPSGTQTITYVAEGIYQIKDDNDTILYLALVEKIIDGETTSYVPHYYAVNSSYSIDNVFITDCKQFTDNDKLEATNVTLQNGKLGFKADGIYHLNLTIPGTIKPYSSGEKADETYFLQGTEYNLRYSITVDDVDLFKLLAKNGDIILSSKYIDGLTTTNCSDICLYYKVGGQAHLVELANVLSTIFASETSTTNFTNYGVLTFNSGTKTYTIILSTKDITYNSNEDEREVRIDLTYTLSGSNIPTSYTNPRVYSTDNFYIYSGKILTAYFGTEGEKITNGSDGYIHIDKSVSGNDFNSSIYKYIDLDKGSIYTFNNGSYTFIKEGTYYIIINEDTYKVVVEEGVEENAGTLPQTWSKDGTSVTAPTVDGSRIYIDITNLFDEDNYLNIYLKSFGIDDFINIVSSDPSVIQVNYDTNGYSLSFLKTGEASISLIPNYPHSDFETITLNFVVNSQYTLSQDYLTTEEEQEGVDERITGYSNGLYSIVGVKNIEEAGEIFFNELLKIKANVGENLADVTLKYNFYLTYDIIKFNSTPQVEPTTVNGSVSFNSIMTFNDTNKTYTYLSDETCIVLVGDTYYKVIITSDEEEPPTYTAEWYIIEWEVSAVPEIEPTTVNGSEDFSSIMTFDSETEEYTYLSDGTCIVLVGDTYYKVIITSDEEEPPTYTAEWYIIKTTKIYTEDYLIYSNLYPDGKIQLIEDGGNLIGFKIMNNFGSETNLVVSAISTELGSTFVFNIKIMPNYQIVGNIDIANTHAKATLPTGSEAGAKAVFAEADIEVSGYYYQQYTSGYETVSFPTLTYVLYGINGKLTDIYTKPSDSLPLDLKIPDSDSILATLTFSSGELTNIRFGAVDSQTKYILRIQWPNGDNAYDLRKEYIFYVSPNIQVKDLIDIEELEDAEGNIYYSLNNEDNPILNGNSLTFNTETGTATIGNYSVEFSRILEGTAFTENFGFLITIEETINKKITGYDVLNTTDDVNICTLTDDGVLEFSQVGNFAISIITASETKTYTVLVLNDNEIYTAYVYSITYTVSGAKKLEQQKLKVSYEGVVFTINYWVAPNITISDNAKTVTFDGEEYIALYAGQSVVDLNSWFKYGTSGTGISLKLGKRIVNVNSILSLPRLYALNGVVSFTEDGVEYSINKNSYGLVETSMIVSYGADNTREFVVFDVLIFPMEWNYVEYKQTEPIGITNVDVLETTNDDNICTLSDGKLTFLQAGKFEIEVTIDETDYTYIVVVIENTKNEITTYNPTYYLQSNSPAGITNVDVLETTNDDNICTLSDGKLTFLQAGEFEIEVTINDHASDYRVIVVKNTENEITTYNPTYYLKTTDITNIFDGDYSKEVESGFKYQISTNFISSDSSLQTNFDTYVSLNYIKYKLYLITDDGETEIINDVSNNVYIGIVGGKLTLVTEPLGEDVSYRIEFTYTRTAEGYANAVYKFNYYVDISATQEIGINYPYSSTEKSYNGVIGNFDVCQNIYYSQFSNDQYIIDLNSSLRNFNDTFVKLYVNKILVSQGGSNLPSYNTLNFEVYKVYDYASGSAVEITGTQRDYFVSVSDDGIVTLLNYNKSKVGYIIKVSTSNGAVNYYKIITQEKPAALKVYQNISGVDTEIDLNSTITMGDSSAGTVTVNETVFTVSKEFDLGDIGTDSFSYDLKFSLIDSTGKVLDSTNSMIFISGSKVYSKVAANEQSATLVVYTETNGIIGEYEILAESDYSVDQHWPENMYGDSEIDLSDYITVNKNDSAVPNLVYELVFNNNANYINKTLEEGNLFDGSIFKVKPVKDILTLNILVKITSSTDAGLLGSSAATTCMVPITLTIQPNITITAESSRVGSTSANNSHTINTNTLFTDAGSSISLDNKYHYNVSYSWDGGAGETLTFEGSVTSITGVEISSLNNTISLNIGHVAATRTAYITVVLYKVDSFAVVVGETFSATYTLTIYPDTLVEVSYPDYNTGVNFTSEYIYWSDWTTLGSGRDILGTILFKLGNGTEITETDLESAEHTVKYSSSSSIVDVNENTGKITSVSQVSSNTSVKIYVKIDNLTRAEYNLTVTNYPIFTAKYSDNTNTKTENINSGGKLFDVNNGKIQVQTKSNTADRPFTLTINATPKNSGIGALPSATLYGIGGFSRRYSELYLLTGEGATISTFSDIYSYDILGRTDDADIWEISGVNYTFVQTSGTYYVTMSNGDKYKITITSSTVATWEKLVGENYGSSTKPSNVYPVSVSTSTTTTDNNFSDVLTFTVSLNYKEEGVYAIKINKYNSETTTAPTYYYVKVTKSGTSPNYTYTPKYYTSTQTSLTLADLFGNSDLDMYTFWATTSDTTVVYQAPITQPSSLLTYYYAGYQIPYSKAETIYYTSSTLSASTQIEDFTATTDYNVQKTVNIYNQFGTPVATYIYTLVRDFYFPAESFDEVIITGTGENRIIESLQEEEYNDDEFDNYGPGTRYISSTIELDAGTSYDLVTLLVSKLDIKAFDGSNFISTNVTINLTYASYISNNRYLSNKSGILGLSYVSSTHSYTITPYGAQNGGDIVHLRLSLGDSKIYILRIKIIPNIEIISASDTGELSTKYDNGTDGIMDYPLSSFLSSISGLTADKLSLSVVNDIDSNTQFVEGSGSNRLHQYTSVENTDSTDIDSYYIKLYETVLGRVQIKFIITDPYGYVATDGDGNPIIFTLNYNNFSQVTPQFISAESTSSIYEGDTFSIIYKTNNSVEGVVYYRYYLNGSSWSLEKLMTVPTSGNNIILDNIPTFVGKYTIEVEGEPQTKYKIYNWISPYWSGDALDEPPTGNIIIIESESAPTTPLSLFTPTLSTNLPSLSDLIEGAGNETLGMGYLPNTRFGSSTSITGNTLTLTLNYTHTVSGVPITETCQIPLNIAIKQRYQLQYNDPYDDYDFLYLRNSLKFSSGTSYNLSDLFKIVDLKSGGTIGIEFTTISNTNAGELKLTNSGKGNLSNYTLTLNRSIDLSYNSQKIAEGGTQVLTFALKNGEIPLSSNNTFVINYKITPYYYSLDISEIETYGDYGIIVIGDSSSTDLTLNQWGRDIYLRDYYGNYIVYSSLYSYSSSKTVLVNADNWIKLSGPGEVTYSDDKLTYSADGTYYIKVIAGEYVYVCEARISEGGDVTRYDFCSSLGTIPDGSRQISSETLNGIESCEVLYSTGGINPTLDDGELSFDSSGIDPGNYDYYVINVEIGGIKYLYRITVDSDGNVRYRICLSGFFPEELSLAKQSGSGDFDEEYNITGISAGQSINVNVLAETNYILGTVILTLNKYIALNGVVTEVTPYDIGSGELVLPFSLPSEDEYGWGEGIYAITAGLNGRNEPIVSGGHFEYHIDSTESEGFISYNSVLNCYVVDSYGDEKEIIIDVSYMGADIGEIHLIKTDEGWSATAKIISIEEMTYELDNENNTMIIKSITTLNGEDKYLINDKYTIDEVEYTVTEIGDGSTTLDEDVAIIIMPETLNKINSEAFSNCDHLYSISIPAGVANIGDSAFYYCYNLESINLPSSVTSIGSGVFQGCQNLKSVDLPEGLSVLSNSMFEGCWDLSSISIPAGVISIGDRTFLACRSLATVIFEGDSGITSIGEGAFSYCENLESIELTAGLTVIGIGAFSDCIKLESITIPSSITSISDYTFRNCTSLTTITIPSSVTSIGISAFDFEDVEASNLEEVIFEIGTQLNKIKDSAFRNCIKLTSISFPTGILTIGDEAFYNCELLDNLILPNSLTSIGESAFSECIGLSQVSILCSADIQLGLFAGCSNLASVTFNNSIKTIGSGAFCLCSSLTTINLPTGLESIGDMAFLGSALISIYIPSGVSSIVEYPFGSCLNLAQISVSASNTKYLSVDGVLFNKNPTTTLISYPNAREVTYVIPNNVATIGTGAFYGCSGLTSITIPSNVTSIEGGAFYGCSGLSSITIPSTVTTIGASAFRECIGLTSIIIPSSVTSLNTAALFYGCSSLTSVFINANITSIGGSAFYGCTNLTSANIPNSVTTISSEAFKNCSSLESITIPSSVTYIGYAAFYGCTSLITVTCLPTTPPTLGSGSYGYMALFAYSTCNILVPANKLTTYKSASEWTLYASRIFAIEE